jgi:hypothetical protein
MRLILGFFLVSLSLQAQFFAPLYPNSVAKNNLIVDYDFQNPVSYSGTGTSVASTNGKNLPATLNGTSPTFFSDPGYVRFLPANGNYLMVGDLKNYYPQVTSATRSGVFTMSLWFNPTSANGVVLADLNSTTVAGGYHTTDIEMVGGYLKFSVWPKTLIITSAATISLNAWHHVVLTYTGNKIAAYIDGSLVNTATYNRDGPAMGSLTSSQYFALGAYDNVTNMGSGAYGSFLLGDVKYFANSLGAAEVSRLYMEEKVNYDLSFMLDAGNVSSYPGSGTTWNDISGAGKTADIRTGMSYATTASGCMYFNGSTYSNFGFNLNGATTLTVEMWVYPTVLNGGMFFGFYTYDVYTYNGALGYNTSAGDLFGLNSTQTSGFINNWKHYVFVMKSGSVTSNKIYVNGVQQSLSQVMASPSNADATFNGGIGRIGAWAINANYLQSMYLTKFKIYNRELTQAEITSKFNKDKARHGL